MRTTSVLAAMLITALAAAQEKNHFNQYSLEIAAGLNHSANPSTTGLHHFDIGFRYMQTEFWGAKLEYGYDTYRAANRTSTQNRATLQAVYNLGRALRFRDVAPEVFNFLLHGGAGLTVIETNEGHIDKGMNAIVGGTAQFYISPQFALTGDLSGMFNFKQNYRFNSSYRNPYFTGKSATLSVGITYYFGRNGSTSDWH